MQTQIKQWGNSAVVRLPAVMLAEMSLSVGSPIELHPKDGHIVIEPIRTKRQGWFSVKLKPEEDAFATLPPDEGDSEWVW